MKARFAIITDAHYGPAPWYKECNRLMAAESPQVLSRLVEKLNQERDIEFVIQLGDLIQENVQNPSHKEDLENFHKALTILKGLRVPLYHTVGNHCKATLTDGNLMEAFTYESLYYTFESKDFQHIVLFSESFEHKNIRIAQKQIDWLANQLIAADKPVFIYLHHQLVEHSLENSFSFNGTPEKAFVQNAEDVRFVIEASGKVRGVFNGHMHANNYLVSGGVPYFTIQSMIEDFDMTGKPCENYAIVAVDDRSVKVEIKGRDSATFEYPSPEVVQTAA